MSSFAIETSTGILSLYVQLFSYSVAIRNFMKNMIDISMKISKISKVMKTNNTALNTFIIMILKFC